MKGIERRHIWGCLGDIGSPLRIVVIYVCIAYTSDFFVRMTQKEVEGRWETLKMVGSVFRE